MIDRRGTASTLAARLATIEHDPTGAAIGHALTILPFVMLASLLYVSVGSHAVAEDFVHAYRPAARTLLAGHSPYNGPVDTPTAFVYPPIAGYLMVPLALLPAGAAAGIATALMVLAIPATLALLGVRDWRCYSITLLWFPSVFGIQTANLTVLLALGTAAFWRYRDRPAAAGALTGLVVALKLYMWPLALFLVFTHRLKATAVAIASACAFVFVPWLWNGFAGLTSYPHRMLEFEAAKRLNSYTLGALLAPATGWTAAHAVTLLAGAGMVALVWRLREEEAKMVVALAATLVLSPVVREEYFVVLIIVLAITRTPFGWPWLLPIAYWCAWQSGQLAQWRIAATLGITALTFASPFIADRLRRPMRQKVEPAVSPIPRSGRVQPMAVDDPLM